MGVFIQNLMIKLNKKDGKNAAEENRKPIIFQNITPHSFRPTFDTKCFESGINGKIV